MRHGRDEGEVPPSMREAPPAPVVRPLVGRLTAAVRPEAPDAVLLEAYRIVILDQAREAARLTHLAQGSAQPRDALVDADRVGRIVGGLIKRRVELTQRRAVPAQPQQPIREAAEARGQQEITLAPDSATHAVQGSPTRI